MPSLGNYDHVNSCLFFLTQPPEPPHPPINAIVELKTTAPNSRSSPRLDRNRAQYDY